MKKRIIIPIYFFVFLLLAGCSKASANAPIVATTGPVYQFTQALCDGTDLTVTQLITDDVSCLHDYTLRVSQMQAVESAETVILSGAGLEEFMDDILSDIDTVIDCSTGVNVMSYGEDHDHEHDHDHNQDHHHEHDPHIWLSPENASIMAQNIYSGLCGKYPAWTSTFRKNLDSLLAQLDALQAYGEETLSSLPGREMITFHDGFAYFAHSFDLTILEAVEEESGSEASAKELKHLINLVQEHHLPAIFTEVNGSTSAAGVISRETGATVHALDMAMASDDYFRSMYNNINTIKEALG